MPRRDIVIVAILFAFLPAAAQTTGPDLRGIYVGGNDITNENPKSLAAALTVPGVDALLLNIGWAEIEPSIGQYQWSTLDQWASMAIAGGRRLTISVGAGLNTPPWLFQAAPGGGGATPLSFSISRKDGNSGACIPETIAAPWDTAFLKQWDAMLAALSAHLKNSGFYDHVVLLRLTGVNLDSDELHLPTETAQSTGLACVSNAITTWQQAGYRPSLLLQGWDGITSSFQKYFPDKSFTVAIIARTNTPFPPIGEDGNVLTGAIPDLSGPPLTLASQKFPGHLVIQNNTLYADSPAQPATAQFAQSLATLLAYQTNEDLVGSNGKYAACTEPDNGETPCNDTTYLQMLNTGVYPLGTSNALRAQYLEIFSADANSFPADVLKAHFELDPPQVSLVANAEGESPVIAPNTWVEIKGRSLALTGSTRVWRGPDFVNGQMPTQLEGVSATVNGKPAYVYYISPTQVNVLTPPDPLSGSVQVQVANNGTPTAAFTAQAHAASPSFFVFNGGPYLAATHLGGAYIGPINLFLGLTTPAKPRELIVFYGNGFGATSSPVVPGSSTQSGTLVPSPVIKIGGVQASVIFAGLAAAGQFQFNVVVPAGLADGDQPVTCTYNGSATQAGTLLTVQH